MRTTWLALLALACTGGDDTGHTGDTGDTAADTVPFAGEVQAADETSPPADATVVLMEMVMGQQDPFGEVWMQTDASGLSAGGSAAFSFDLPAQVPEEDLYGIDDGSSVGTWYVGAYADTDASGDFSAGDTPVGGSGTLLAYVQDPGADVTALGGAEGWNLLHFDYETLDSGPTSATPIPGGDEAFTVPGNLLIHSPGSLSGTLAPDPGGDFTVLVTSVIETMGASAPSDPTLAALDVTGAGADTSFTFASALPTPPDDHVIEGTGPFDGFDMGVWALMAIDDANANDLLDGGEALYGGSVWAQDGPTAVFWLEPTDLAMGWILDLNDMRGGYGLVEAVENEPPVGVAWATGLTLVVPPPSR